MHVLIVPSWYPRDASDINGSFFREQALALHKNGCRVGVIHPDLRSLREWRSITSGPRGICCELDHGVATYRSCGMNWFPRTAGPAAWLHVWHGLRLYERYVAANGRPDVLHAHSLLFAGAVAAEIRRRYGVPFVVTEHSSTFARGLVSTEALRVAKAACAQAAHRFAVSHALARLLDRVLMPEGANWEYLPNTVSEDFIIEAVAHRRDDSDFHFINIGMMNENKGQASTLRAFADIARTYPEVRLIFVGDGPCRTFLENETRALGLADRVVFTGILAREAVCKSIAAADVLVLSSRYETFGVVLIEALALGKPVIATRCGGPESIVEEGDGVLVPVDDVPSLAAAMSRMRSSRATYDREAIRASCLRRFSEAAITSRLKALYRSASLTQSMSASC
jgi:glycosyltransferase involved in cell wall biosynthesis